MRLAGCGGPARRYHASMAEGLAERWKRSLPSVRESALRAAFLRSELLAADRDAAAEALDSLADGAEQADPVARDVLAAALPTLTDPAHLEWVEALRETAQERSLLALARLLRRRRASDAPDHGDPATRPLRTPPGARTLTLGERKALARRPTRQQLDRLLADPHPAVIRALLCNTRITEDDVVRMAARRPAYPDVLREIAQAPQWTRHARVRMALVQNPDTPPEVAVPLCGLLIKPELRQVVGAVDVPAIVRAAAVELLQRRPPSPSGNPAPGGESLQ
jgi:hypothetical protein